MATFIQGLLYVRSLTYIIPFNLKYNPKVQTIFMPILQMRQLRL